MGTAIAAQQKTPPNHRIPCTARGDRSSPRRSSTRTPTAPPAAVTGGRGRSRRASGIIVIAAKTLKYRNVPRQPTVSLKCCTTAGQIAPASPCPEVRMATASPRRRSNQRVTFATSGAIIAALPKRPMRRPEAMKRLTGPSARLARSAPRLIITEPNSTGCMTPRRSIHQPMAMPPTPAPTIISE